jgi:hypothetical protein
LDAAAGDPLLMAMAASLVPREVAFGVTPPPSAAAPVPAVKDVARLAKWFAANIDAAAPGRASASLRL